MVILTRFAFPPDATFGTLAVEDLKLVTVELPWLGNAPTISCVPSGEYRLEPHESTHYENAWALVGGSVAHYPERGAIRSACLFHAANWARQLQGCIAPGSTISHVQGELGVTSSGASLKRLDAILRRLTPEERVLRIQYAGQGARP